MFVLSKNVDFYLEVNVVTFIFPLSTAKHSFVITYAIQSPVTSKNGHQNFSRRLVISDGNNWWNLWVLISGSRQCEQDTWCVHANLPLLLPQLPGCHSRHRGGRMGIDHATASQRRIRINLQCRRTGLNNNGTISAVFAFWIKCFYFGKGHHNFLHELSVIRGINRRN